MLSSGYIKRYIGNKFTAELLVKTEERLCSTHYNKVIIISFCVFSTGAEHFDSVRDQIILRNAFILFLN